MRMCLNSAASAGSRGLAIEYPVGGKGVDYRQHVGVVAVITICCVAWGMRWQTGRGGQRDFVLEDLAPGNVCERNQTHAKRAPAPRAAGRAAACYRKRSRWRRRCLKIHGVFQSRWDRAGRLPSRVTVRASSRFDSFHGESATLIARRPRCPPHWIWDDERPRTAFQSTRGCAG